MFEVMEGLLSVRLFFIITQHILSHFTEVDCYLSIDRHYWDSGCRFNKVDDPNQTISVVLARYF
jgi:hypothetical protein